MILIFLDGLQNRISTAFNDIRQGARAARCLVPTIAIVLAGCSIHPLQQEVTGVRTPDLVNFIRCETRLAIQDKAIDLLEHEPTINPPVIATLKELRGQRWRSDVRAGMTPQEARIYDKYIETGIAFDFSFDITEGDGVGGIADPIKLITNGSAGIGLAASGDFKRQNLRHFIVSDTARNLLENRDLRCTSDYRGSNYIYPISGSIGMKELISTFFDLNEIRPLTEVDKATTVFADTLTFTTTFVGSVSPHVIVAPVGSGLGLAPPGASITGGASRIDKHSVIIGLSLDKPKGKLVTAAAVLPGTARRSALQRGSVRSPTEQSALDAVSQARIDAYLDRAVR